MICVLCFCNMFLFLPQKRPPSRTGQSQNWWQHLNSRCWGLPRDAQQDRLRPGVCREQRRSAAPQLCWAIGAGSLRGAGNLS